MTDTQNIVVEEVLPHTPDVIWKALTTGDLIGRWLMPATGFEAVKGNRFTFTTRPAGPVWWVTKVMPSMRSASFFTS